MTPTIAAVRARAVSVSAWVWVGAIVVVSAAVRIALARRMVAPWIMVDELIYSELAKSFASDGRFLVRGVPSTGYGFVYPILISPAYALFAHVPRAYTAAKDINSVVMSLTAIPAYLLARRLLPTRASLAVALLSVAIPSMVYTGTLMTENAFYPLFVLALLTLLAMLERPTARHQVAALVVSALCFATRAQAIVLFGVAVVAPLLHGWIERDLRVRVRRFVVLYGIVGAVVVVALGASAARGRSPLAVLGAYRAATGSGYSVSVVAKYVLWHFAELDLYVGVIGFAALLAMWGAPRLSSPAARAFTAISLPVVVLLLVEVAVFASRESFRIEERNDFYVTPLFLVALLGLRDEGVVSRRRPVVLVAAAVAGVLPVAIPLATLVNTSIVSDTLGLMPWWWLQDQGIAFGPLRFVVLAVGLVAAAAFVVVPRRAAPVLAAVTAVYFVLVGLYVENGRHGVQHASLGALFAGIRNPNPDWIDRAIGTDGNTAFIWHWYAGETHPLWENEFFNRSVGTVLMMHGPNPSDAGLPATSVHERADGVLVRTDGSVPQVRYVVSYVGVAGREIAHDDGLGLGLYRVDGPIVIVSHVYGLYVHDTWGRRLVTYKRFRCTGGTVVVQIGTDSQLFGRDQVITAREEGRVVARKRIAPTERAIMRVPLRPLAGVCTVRFLAATTRVPAEVLPGSSDTRPLAAHYYAFDYVAP